MIILGSLLTTFEVITTFEATMGQLQQLIQRKSKRQIELGLSKALIHMVCFQTFNLMRDLFRLHAKAKLSH